MTKQEQKILNELEEIKKAVYHGKRHKKVRAAQDLKTTSELIKEIEAAFIWGQVPYHDIKSGTTKEWTMHCISEEDWQSIKERLQGGNKENVRIQQ